LAAAALRETREETGLELNENDHHPEVIEHSFEYENRGQVYQEHGFSIHLKHSPPPLKLDPKEHVEYQWVTAKEAFKTIAHPSNAAMLKILLTRLAKQ
jgi:8-oxo-dGTP pyrophosphatase MutT (NUDIX family)